MPANNTIILWLLSAVLLAGCVEPYTPVIKENQKFLVVEGLLSDQPGFQYIYVSHTTPFNDPKQDPYTQCQVSVVDENDNTYSFTEVDSGAYALWMNEGELPRDISYKLIVTLPDGDGRYESDWEMLGEPCAPIDSLYFELEIAKTSYGEDIAKGLQFYVDVNAENEQSQNYRWVLTETFEYNALNSIQYYWDGQSVHNMPDPFIYHTCWYIDRVGGVFTSTTRESEQQKILRYPLNYISDRTNHLLIRYSLLVQQYSLSDDAFDYWDRIRKQLQEVGGLYETQPVQLKGNLININDPDEIVLGYFNVSSTTEKRVFVDDLPRMNLPGYTCSLISVFRTRFIPRDWPLPVYMRSLNETGAGPPYGIGRGICFDCRTLGGNNIRPDYW